MNFKAIRKYKNTGTVYLVADDNLRQITNNIPDLPGVYMFSIVKGKHDILQYVGSSGSIQQNGKFKGQMMRGRINNKMNSKQSRAQFFKSYFKKNDIDSIRIDWFNTYDDEYIDLPKYVEACMLQEYFSLFGKLPQWNNSF